MKQLVHDNNKHNSLFYLDLFNLTKTKSFNSETMLFEIIILASIVLLVYSTLDMCTVYINYRKR